MRTNGHFFDWGFGLAWTALAALIIGTTWLATPAPVQASAMTAASTSASTSVMDTYYFQADATRSQRGIMGYELSKTSDNRLRISVDSQHRAADIYVDPTPSEGIMVVAVDVASSGETLLFTHDSGGGSISVNGNQVATWEHLGNAQYECFNCNQLGSFTSWNILSDTFADENLNSENLITTAFWLGFLGVVIGALAFVVSLTTCSIVYTNAATNTNQVITMTESQCATHGASCYDAGYDPAHPSCVYWFNQCSGMQTFTIWCEVVNALCNGGDDEYCDLYWEHCNQ